MTALLALEQVTKSFTQRRGSHRRVQAVAGVSLAVGRGETLGLVGESGCGKSSLARLALRLTEVSSGRVIFDGADVTDWEARRLLPVRRRLQAVFQDPMGSFNPRMTVAEIMAEPFRTHGIALKEKLAPRIRELLSFVGLEAIDLAKRPGEFSGGQLQRIAIARALALEPALIVADEPTSALDPSIQAQIVNLLLRIQRERGLAYLIISHDLEVIGHVSDQIAVMYLGVIVETGSAAAIMAEPLHPYTQALLSAAPTLAARRDRNWRRITLAGDLPNPAEAPSGCRFHPRCPLARARCREEVPALQPAGAADHQVACHFAPAETMARGIDIGRARIGAARLPPELSAGEERR
jgi:oligopeptide/dipeptide ABC transporter ATP-binding protein